MNRETADEIPGSSAPICAKTAAVWNFRSGGLTVSREKCPVYLTVYENGLQAIPVTELLLTQGMGTCSFTCENNRIGNSGFDVHQAQTLTIACGNGRFLTGCLSSAPVPEALRGEFLIFQKKKRYRLPLRHRQSRSYRRNLQPNQSDSVSRKPCQNRYPSDSHKPCQNRTPIRQPETTPQLETIQQPKTIPQPEAVRQPQASYQKVEIQDIRKLQKAIGICATTVFFCTVFFQLSLSHVENAGNEWRKTTVSWNSWNL